MPRTKLITDEEREQLQPSITMSGECFDCADHGLMAFQIWRRMGRNHEATGAAWRRLMENDCSTHDVMALVAFHVFNSMDTE